MGPDIFCTQYRRWKEEGKVIFENSHAYSILSVTPAVPGHAIVISRAHVSFLEELRGSALEGFVDAISATILAIQGIYELDPERIVRFYQSLKESPPTPASAGMAERMLNHKNLRVTPDWAYNTGRNVGGYAGQMVDHLHEHLFPRREKGPGIVTAMQSIL